MLAYVAIQEETSAVRRVHFNKQHEDAGAGSVTAFSQHILTFSIIIAIKNNPKQQQLPF